MKLSNLNLGLLALFFLTLTACSKSDDEGETPTPPATTTGKMTATIGQNTFTSADTYARHRSTGKFTISATTTEGESLFFVIDNFVGALDYSFGPNLPNSARYTYQFGGNIQTFSTADGGSGVLTVTSYNEAEKKISGVFSLTVLQTTNLGNSLQITEGSFTNVALTNLEAPEAGTMAYYADDYLYVSANPNLSVSPTLNINFELAAPNGDFEIRIISGHADFTADIAFMISGFQYIPLDISDFSLVDGKITLHLKNPENRDFELWMKDYPIEHPFWTNDQATLTFFTDTATFTSTSITIINYVNDSSGKNVIFSSVNSNGTNVFSGSISDGYGSLTLEYGNSSLFPFGGDGRVIFDSSGTSVSYLSFVSQDSSLVMVGRDIPL